MAPLEGHVLDGGPARFADPQPVQPQQDGEKTRRLGSMPASGDVVGLDLGLPEGREAGFQTPQFW